MKQTLTCPKCNGGRIWHMNVMGERSGDGAVKPISIAFDEASSDPSGKGFFETFICDACGFTEWYARGLRGLQPDPSRGIFLRERGR